MSVFWKTLIIIFLIAILIAGIFYNSTKPNYPTIVNLYKYRYEQMSDSNAKNQLIDYTKSINDSIEGLNYSELLVWEHNHLKYPNTNNYRPELPIDILKEGEGNCGEFALLYTGLCLANNIKVRLVIDCSVKTDNRTAGDHVFVQVWVNGSWLHVDPTENRVGHPEWYVDVWHKNVNLVYAITNEEIINVTERYN